MHSVYSRKWMWKEIRDNQGRQYMIYQGNQMLESGHRVWIFVWMRKMLVGLWFAVAVHSVLPLWWNSLACKNDIDTMPILLRDLLRVILARANSSVFNKRTINTWQISVESFLETLTYLYQAGTFCQQTNASFNVCKTPNVIFSFEKFCQKI